MVIYRLPEMMKREWHAQCAEFRGEPVPVTTRLTLSSPPSSCSCGHLITPLENIPVLSYLFLRGKCSGCGMKISLQYPAIELATALLSLLVAWHYGLTTQGLLAIVFGWVAIALSGIDIKEQLLPDDIVLPLMWVGLAININSVFIPLSEAVIGAMAGYLSLWSIYWAFLILTKKEGMGYGDFKLLAAIGAWIGFKLLPLVLVLSGVVAAVVGIALILLGRKDIGSKLPFGPYLCGGGLIAMMYGQSILATF